MPGELWLLSCPLHSAISHCVAANRVDMVEICWRVAARRGKVPNKRECVRAARLTKIPILSYRRWLKKKKTSDLLLLFACAEMFCCVV